MDTKTEALLNRVRLGNFRLHEAWVVACRAETDELFERHMAKVDKASPLLESLCLELEVSGYETCLYDKPRCRDSADKNWWCYVCPAKVMPPVQQELTPQNSQVLKALKESSTFFHLAGKYEALIVSSLGEPVGYVVEPSLGAVSLKGASLPVVEASSAAQVEADWLGLVAGNSAKEVKV